MEKNKIALGDILRSLESEWLCFWVVVL